MKMKMKMKMDMDSKLDRKKNFYCRGIGIFFGF